MEVIFKKRQPNLTIMFTLLKNTVDWTQRSSSNPLTRNKKVRSLENISVFSTTL